MVDPNQIISKNKQTIETRQSKQSSQESEVVVVKALEPEEDLIEKMRLEKMAQQVEMEYRREDNRV